jgi:hypothetical protein
MRLRLGMLSSGAKEGKAQCITKPYKSYHVIGVAGTIMNIGR